MKNLNVFYLAAFDKNKSSGVEKKIITQIENLSNLNVYVNRVGWTIGNNQVLCAVNKIKLLHNIISASRKDDNTDILYIRGCFNYILCLSLVFLRPRHLKIVFELQSIQSNEFKNTRNPNILWHLLSKLKSKIDSFFISWILNSSDAIVSVTSEINHWYKELTHNKLHYLVLGNGISTSSLPISRRPEMIGVLNVLCVAKVDIWHGVDRFIRGLHEYESVPDKRNIVLHIVGDGPELPYLKELATDLNMQDSVIFHGFKSGKELDEMFDMCHIALGSLGGFRINMHEMSSLKSGEYCARGMPFVIAAKAIDFPDDWPYILHVPETEDSINMDDIIMFANRIIADTNHPRVMREYAEENLDWSIKMKNLKEFLESL